MSNPVGFNLRMTAEEREAVRIMAKRELRSDTAVIRRAIIEAAKRHGIEIPTAEDAEEKAAA